MPGKTTSPKTFIASDYPDPRPFTRNNRTVFLDACRCVLVPATPEELVRQKCVSHLVCELGVPIGNIATEKNLAHFGEGLRGRADIVVFTDSGEPLMIIECKAPQIRASDDSIDQVMGYHASMGGGVKVVAVLNGVSESWFRVNASDNLEQLLHAPRYDELIIGVYPKQAPAFVLPGRPSPSFLTSAERKFFVDDAGTIGAGSPEVHHRFWANLAGLLFLTKDEPVYIGVEGKFSVEETGLRDTKFGDAGGGSFQCTYRYLLSPRT